MREGSSRKGIVVAIICLFIGVSVTSIGGAIVEEQDSINAKVERSYYLQDGYNDDVTVTTLAGTPGIPYGFPVPAWHQGSEGKGDG